MTVEISNNKISLHISSQLPEFVREDHPTFIAFLEAYYQYLEQANGVTYFANQLMTAHDIDETLDIFASRLYNQFLEILPENVQADKALILKNSKSFLR